MSKMKLTRLNKVYIKMWANIKKYIDEGHHPDDIQTDDPELLESIYDELELFQEACSNEREPALESLAQIVKLIMSEELLDDRLEYDNDDLMSAYDINKADAKLLHLLLRVESYRI